jgi:hypothetical protein
MNRLSSLVLHGEGFGKPSFGQSSAEPSHAINCSTHKLHYINYKDLLLELLLAEELLIPGRVTYASHPLLD